MPKPPVFRQEVVPPPSSSSEPRVAPVKANLLEKAGEKDGDTTFTRLVDEALDAMSGLSESERRDLRAVARKRQAAFKHDLTDGSLAQGSVGALDEDKWSGFERDILGPERYATYWSSLNQVMQSAVRPTQ